MSLADLQKKIRTQTARIGIIGLGYVGLPVACEFGRVGFEVIGVELRADRVAQINAGVSPIEGNEPGLQDLLAQVIASGKLRATTQYGDLAACDVVLIDVETPVDDTNVPRYAALRAALASLGAVLRPGALVIIESTIAPGTMRGLVQPQLEASTGGCLNERFYLGNCPERVMPGRLLRNLREISRVVGGMTPETAQVMIELYRQVVNGELDPTDCVTAELVKTAENAYRDVQIAFANEVALICEAVGGDVWKVRELVNKSPFRAMHLPGAGVGGHCIPKDPWLLAYQASQNGTAIRLIPAARAVNSSMPQHMIDLLEPALAAAGIRLAGASILVMGYAYLEDSDDTRDSPSAHLVTALQARAARPLIHDPHVPEYAGDWRDLAAQADAVVFMVRHTAYRELDLAELQAALRQPILIDGRALFDPEALRAAGWTYRRVGLAEPSV